MLTKHQKDSILALRYQGQSYRAVADSMGLSANTVKSFCRRNDVNKADEAEAAAENICRNCGAMLFQTPGAKKKFFCCDKCRYAWWNRHKSKHPYQLTCCYCGRKFISFGNKKRRFCGRECYRRSRYGEGLP